MNLDFLSGMFGGQGNNGNLIGMLLPMFLGGKGLDLSSMFGNKPNDKSTSSTSDSFPPLFGSNAGSGSGDMNGLFQILGNLGKRTEVTKKADPVKDNAYPYELQYNRPYKEQ